MNHRDIPKRWQAIIDADPESELSKKYLVIQKRLRSIEFYEKKVQTVVKKSHVGTRLMQKFKVSVGAVPCSACKQMMIRLDLMSIDDIRANHNSIVFEIEKNARKAKAKWWANIMLKADELFVGGLVTQLLISKFLAEACDDEAASVLLDSDSGPADMGGH